MDIVQVQSLSTVPALEAHFRTFAQGFGVFYHGRGQVITNALWPHYGLTPTYTRRLR